MMSVSLIMKNDVAKMKKFNRVQDVIPIEAVYQSGMFKHENSRYSKTYSIADIDYQSASDTERQKVFDDWSEVLNSLDSSKSSMKITIINRRMNKKHKLQQTLLPTDVNDGYDNLRLAYNRLRYDDIQGDKGFIQDKFVTFSSFRKNTEKAEMHFQRLERDLNKKLMGFGSSLKSQTLYSRGEIIHSFLRAGHEAEYNYWYDDTASVRKNTKNFINCITADVIRPKASYFEMNGMVGRAMVMRSFGNAIKDDLFTRLAEVRTNMIVTLDVIPVSNSEARKIIERKDDDVETNANLWSGKRNVREGAAERLPRQISKDRKVIDAYNQAMDYDNQKMFLNQIIVCFLAENLDQLEDFTESIQDTAGDYNCEMSILWFQQLKGLVDALPFGSRTIQCLRDCDTDTTAIMLPFNSVRLTQSTGIPYGKHEETQQQQWVDRRLQGSGHEWILGKTGFGKSVDSKLKILYEALLTDGDSVILDPDGEYAPLVQALGGQIVRVGIDNINVAEISADYGYVAEDDYRDPVAKKSNLILSFIEAILDETTRFGEMEKSLVDRAVRTLAKAVLEGQYNCMTLEDIYDILMQYEEPAARNLALALERHIKGSFNSFSKPTNVYIQSRIVCYDLSTLNKQEKDAAMIVVLDQIDQRLIVNRRMGKATYITFDEMDYFFKHQTATLIIEDFFERCRKYGGFLRAIVQNVTKILQNPNAATMIKNSENVIMLKQDYLDAVQLAEMYSMSPIQVNKLENAEVGHGIAKIGNTIYAFDGTIPEDNEIFQFVNTNVLKSFDSDIA